jgi:hypothetical protein
MVELIVGVNEDGTVNNKRKRGFDLMGTIVISIIQFATELEEVVSRGNYRHISEI